MRKFNCFFYTFSNSDRLLAVHLRSPASPLYLSLPISGTRPQVMSSVQATPTRQATTFRALSLRAMVVDLSIHALEADADLILDNNNDVEEAWDKYCADVLHENPALARHFHSNGNVQKVDTMNDISKSLSLDF